MPPADLEIISWKIFQNTRRGFVQHWRFFECRSFRMRGGNRRVKIVSCNYIFQCVHFNAQLDPEAVLLTPSLPLINDMELISMQESFINKIRIRKQALIHNHRKGLVRSVWEDCCSRYQVWIVGVFIRLFSCNKAVLGIKLLIKFEREIKSIFIE